MCDGAVNDFIKNFIMLYSKMMISSFLMKDSGNVIFFGGEMGILSVGLNNINLTDANFYEDDPEIIIHVRLMAWQ